MQKENENLSTEDIVRILMDIYKLSEAEAKKALEEATSRTGMPDF